jgi:vancomycin resistance protein YoaR
VSGLRVDRTALYKDINEQFLASNNVSVELKFIEEVATITKEYNENLTQKIATFSTNVADSTGGRKHNVKLALEKFNGFVLEPNKEVSFNEVTGEHTLENGYKSATIIYNGEFTDGIGGGVCQASTTLYNALLLSGVEINEVHKHTLPVFYVPLAQDAMVSEYTSDLKFTNTTEYPMYIRTYSDSSSVTVEIYSHPGEYTYKTRSETIDTIKAGGDKIISDTDGKYSSKVLFEGEFFRISYPKDGYEAKAYLQKYLGDKLIEEKEIRHEIYQPQKGVVVEGAEKLPDGMNPINTGVTIYTE